MIFLNIVFFPLLLCGFYTLHPNEVIIIETFGKPIKIVNRIGLHWYFPLATRFIRISTAL